MLDFKPSISHRKKEQQKLINLLKSFCKYDDTRPTYAQIVKNSSKTPSAKSLLHPPAKMSSQSETKPTKEQDENEKLHALRKEILGVAISLDK